MSDTQEWTAHPSGIDASINYTRPDPDGVIECRYVRRRPDTIVCYLSSQTGCKQACGFCHLTATKQGRAGDVTLDEYLEQASLVLQGMPGELVGGVSVGEYQAIGARYVHFSFMARGEPLASRYLVNHFESVLEGLASLAKIAGLVPKFKISTIFPSDFSTSVTDFPTLFGPYAPDFYYSLYSTDDNFRSRWLPRAMPVHVALYYLRRYQDVTHKIPRLHWSLMAGMNDSQAEAHRIGAAIKRAELRADVNLVRYNPAGPEMGYETGGDQINRYAAALAEAMPDGTRIKLISRVGFDVAASCGMFADKTGKTGLITLRTPAAPGT